MTKVLFVGPYRQSDGWGNAANEYAKAISKSCELAMRPIYMGSSFCELHEDLLEYEFNDLREYDVVIQNCLPFFVIQTLLIKSAIYFFCGGSVHPGGGIPLCLMSAKIVSNQFKDVSNV